MSTDRPHSEPRIPRSRWFDRVFDFTLPPSAMPRLLERLRSTAPRMEALTRGLDRETLMRRDGHTWSIQENIGHLIDLEDLHLRRLDELEAGASELTAADTENRRTWLACHNERPLAAILDEFRASRATLVRRLEAWPPAELERSGLHPRLKTPMRVIDLAFFTAEHDDHHVARIEALLAMFAA